MKKLYDIEIVVCPELIAKQKQTLLSMMDFLSSEWDDEMWDSMNGLLNLLDAIDDQINDIAN
jgi:hypothetical protein